MEKQSPRETGSLVTREEEGAEGGMCRQESEQRVTRKEMEWMGHGLDRPVFQSGINGYISDLSRYMAVATASEGRGGGVAEVASTSLTSKSLAGMETWSGSRLAEPEEAQTWPQTGIWPRLVGGRRRDRRKRSPGNLADGTRPLQASLQAARCACTCGVRWCVTALLHGVSAHSEKRRRRD